MKKKEEIYKIQNWLLDNKRGDLYFLLRSLGVKRIDKPLPYTFAVIIACTLCEIKMIPSSFLRSIAAETDSLSLRTVYGNLHKLRRYDIIRIIHKDDNRRYIFLNPHIELDKFELQPMSKPGHEPYTC